MTVCIFVFLLLLLFLCFLLFSGFVVVVISHLLLAW